MDDPVILVLEWLAVIFLALGAGAIAFSFLSLLNRPTHRPPPQQGDSRHE